ncbi:hypothetical protein ACI2I2_07040 [Scandinavium sp. NPDC088450]|uniref:hypothetical protein n=1 Tax=Scandinavium sp. NPDC088450 TaxID=3364514 RepID=UPI00384C822D
MDIQNSIGGIDEHIPPYKLYSWGGVIVASLFGTILAGGILMGMNYQRMGMQKEATKTYWITVLVTIAGMTVGTLMPESVSPTTLSVPLLLGISYAAKQLQGPAISQHIEAQGQMESNWKAFGLSLLVALGLLAVGITIAAIIS